MKKVLWFLSLGISCVCVILFSAYSGMRICETHTALADYVGNFFGNIDNIQKKGAGKQSFSFVVIGDTRKGYEIFEHGIRRINKINPDFVMHLGDFVEKAKKHHYDFFIGELKEMMIKVPMFFVAGNHDVFVYPRHDVNRKYFKRKLGNFQFHFVYGNSLFIGMDNSEMNPFNEEQLVWLKDILEKNRTVEHKFIFMHTPPINLNIKKKSSGEYKKDFNRDDPAFRNTIKGYGIDCVFVSHFHGYMEKKVDGVNYLVTGGGGAPLDAGGYHFVIVNVDGQKVDHKVVNMRKIWVFEDRFELMMHTTVYDFIDENKILTVILLIFSSLIIIKSVRDYIKRAR